MIEQIAKNDFYEISVDKTKNRWYLAVKGHWEKTTQVSSYLADTDKAMRQLTNGFSTLADLTQMATPSPEVASLHEGVQKRVLALGGGKTAEVLPAEVLVKATVDQLLQRSQLKTKQFSSRAEAEAWLDEK